MQQKSVLRAALAIGGLAGIVTLSACSPMSSGAPAASQPAAPASQISQPSQTTQVPATQQTTQPAQVSSSTGPAHIYFPLCGGPAAAAKSKIEATAMTFSCDSTLSVVDAHWTSWNNDHAQGTAVLEENDCTPSCAEDVLARNKVTVRFDKPVKKSCGEFWTEAVFTYVGKPVGIVHNQTQWTFNPGDPANYC
ncbi:MAG TPA: hypothetical protein VGN81_12760 [Pseudonocardiaceae bacterium]|jgi:hypothetical protein